MTAPALNTRVYRLTADIAPDTHIGDVDVLGNQARLVELVKTHLTERGFGLGDITPMGFFRREGPKHGDPNWITTEVLVVVKGQTEDIERAVNAFRAPPSYPRIWWELATTELITKRHDFLDARRAHADELRARNVFVGLSKDQASKLGGNPSGFTGRHAAAAEPVNPESLF